MLPFEFIIHRRPLSIQTANRARLQAWKQYVAGEAAKAWGGRGPMALVELRLSLVFLCESTPLDADNVIKPVQDALSGVVYEDDDQIADVDSHRRFFADAMDLTGLPDVLVSAILGGEECVYVRIEESGELGAYL